MKKIITATVALFIAFSYFAYAEDGQIKQDSEKRMEEREKEENAEHDRILLAHEYGKYQFSVDYAADHFDHYEYKNPHDSSYQPKFKTRGYTFMWQYFPLRKTFGRIGAGPRLGLYGKNIRSSDRESGAGYKHDLFPAFTTYGLEATYEAQFLSGQIIVPFAFVGFDKVNVDYTAPTPTGKVNENFDSSTFGVGLKLNLNRLEQKAASAATASLGIKKFFFSVYMLRREAGSADRKATSTFLGLRFEY